MQRRYMKAWFVLLLLLSGLMLSGCGYKPSSHAIQSLFSDRYYVEVEVDRVEPENAPFLKDEMNRMVYTRFKGHLVPKENATTTIHITYGGSTFIPLSYSNGYMSRYEVRVNVKFEMSTPKGKITKVISSRHEAEIQESSLQSLTLRTEAIRKALEKALDEFLAYASAKGTLGAGK